MLKEKDKLLKLEPDENVPDNIAEKVKTTVKTQRSLANVLGVMVGNLAKTLSIVLGSKK